jgi:hypothetical protein
MRDEPEMRKGPMLQGMTFQGQKADRLSIEQMKEFLEGSRQIEFGLGGERRRTGSWSEYCVISTTGVWTRANALPSGSVNKIV